MSGGWQGSNRSSRLPSDWKKRRQRVLKRDGYVCQLQYEGCTFDAEEVDHIEAGKDDHRIQALQSACSHCHAIKSSREGTAQAKAFHAQGYRPQEKHPGLM